MSTHGLIQLRTILCQTRLRPIIFTQPSLTTTITVRPFTNYTLQLPHHPRTLPRLPFQSSHRFASTDSTPIATSLANASRAVQEAKIKEMKKELQAEKDKSKLGTTRMLYAGAGVFAMSELLTGLIAVSCIMAWIGYSVDWSDVVASKDRVLDRAKGEWNKEKKFTTSSTATTNNNSTNAPPIDASTAPSISQSK